MSEKLIQPEKTTSSKLFKFKTNLKPLIQLKKSVHYRRDLDSLGEYLKSEIE